GQREARTLLLALSPDDPEEARRIAQLCALAPLEAREAALVLALAERAAKARPDHASLTTLALAQYRARRAWVALETLDRSRTRGQRERRATVLDELLRSLAHAEVEHPADAAVAVDQARQWFAALAHRKAAAPATLVGLAAHGSLGLLPLAAEPSPQRWRRDGLTAQEWAD